MTPALAVGFAVAGAVGYGFASVLQASAADRAHGTLRTVRDPRYLAGLALDLLAWLASLAALRVLPIYQVQATLAGSLAVTVLAARVMLAVRLRRSDLVAVAVTVAALAALAASAGPQHPAQLSGAGRLGLAAPAVLVGLAGWAAARARASGAAAVTAGLAFGGAALCARAVTLPDAPLRHLPATLASAAGNPLAWALLAYGGAGVLLYANALEHGPVGPVTALLWIAEVAAPSIVGVALLGDTVRPGWTPAAATALLASIAAAAILARPSTPTTGPRDA
ncbi:MAG: hypothetical protein V7637_2859 [Mycobacteriales bacterium]